MKRNFLRLFLMLGLLSLNSCRQDLLPEKETYNNSGAFQLTSQRISLDEAKHKAKLFPELAQVESKFKAFSRKSAHGKTVNYGNGISIETDDVIYIENGPNYHTYTFNIKKESALPSDPLENLLLVPLPDGTYREYLVVYNLSIADKEKIAAGIPVDTQGKTEITELANGTFNGNSQLARLYCFNISQSFWSPCSGKDHHDGSNYQDCPIYNGTQTGTPPIMYTIITNQCIEDNDDVITPIDPGVNGSGGGGGGPPNNNPNIGGNNPPCTTPTIPTSPEPGLVSENGCAIGAPTLPNNPIRNNPCEKTKAMLQRPNIQQGIANVKAQAKLTLTNPLTGEIGFKEKKDGTVVPGDINAAHQVTFNDVTDGVGGYHNHTKKGIHLHSPPDILDTLLGFAAAQSVSDGVGNAYLGMIAAEACSICPDGINYINYVIRYTGTGAELASLVYSPAQMTQFNNQYRDFARDLSEPLLNGTTYINSSGLLSEKGLETLFFDTLKNIGISGKILLQRIEPNGNVYNVTQDSSGTINATPCP